MYALVLIGLGARTEKPVQAALKFTAMESAPSAGDGLAKLITVALSQDQFCQPPANAKWFFRPSPYTMRSLTARDGRRQRIEVERE